MAKMVDIPIGTTFGNWIVLSQDGKTSWGEHLWKCKCQCGTVKSIPSKRLRNGQSKSCGCLRSILVRQKVSLSPGEASLNAILSDYKYSAKIRKLGFELSREQFRLLISTNCYYCGDQPSQIARYGGLLYNGIDRRDNSIGYLYSNTVSCCKRCNYAKKGDNENEFLEWLNRIASRRNNVP